VSARANRPLLAGAIVVLLILVIGVVAAPADARRRPPRPRTAPAAPVVAVYGDSLIVEAADAIRFVVGDRAQVRVQAMGGTAWCDWLGTFAGLTGPAPKAIVFGFSGNNLTPCTGGAAGADLADRYRDDALAAIDAVSARHPTVPIMVVVPPVHRHQDGTPEAHRIAEVYRSLPELRAGVRVVDAGSAVTPDGHYADRLPCLPGEPCEDGTVAVRAPDGVHFCPLAYELGQPCPVPSPGAFRYGAAIAGSVLPLLPVTRNR
jgi:hypothetical protein